MIIETSRKTWLRKAGCAVAAVAMATSMVPATAWAAPGQAAQAETGADAATLAESAELIASGVCGTCAWQIDSSGAMDIYAGTLDEPNINNEWPWGNYLDNITSVSLKGSVVALNCNSMFKDCESLIAVDLTGLDVSAVQDMTEMFKGCTKLISVTIPKLDSSNVRDMRAMFRECRSLKALDLTGLSTIKVQYMGGIGTAGMFRDCDWLESVNISSFDTSSAVYLGYMFAEDWSLKTIYVGDKWTTASLDADHAGNGDVFDGCKSLVGGAGTLFNESNNYIAYARIDGGPTSSTPGYFTDGANVKHMSDAVIEAVPDQKYTGQVIKPKLTVTYEGNVLAEGTDYTVTYANNTNQGRGIAVITGIYGLQGTKSVFFDIVDEVTPEPEPAPEGTANVYRLYNPATSEHLWTTDYNEYQTLKAYGWNQEDVAWLAPTSGTGVYRLYNPGLGTHHYTSDQNEISVLQGMGWQLDNGGEPLYYSAEESAADAAAVYRLYNDGLSQHMLTMDGNEYDVLATVGWKQEGIAFYAIES